MGSTLFQFHFFLNHWLSRSYSIVCCNCLFHHCQNKMAARYPEMVWTTKDTADEFKLFKQKMKLCFEDNALTDAKKQATKIKIAVGNEGLRKINASGLSDQEKEDPDQLWSLFEDQLKIKVNFRIHRLEFMRYKQKSSESIDDFVTRCRQKGSECDLTAEELAERVIELVINSNINRDIPEGINGKTKRVPIEVPP